jgi:hypothetical protein
MDLPHVDADPMFVLEELSAEKAAGFEFGVRSSEFGVRSSEFGVARVAPVIMPPPHP